MYGLPENTDLGFLKEQVLRQVCVGANEVILRFADDISITCQTDIGHKKAGVCTALYRDMITCGAMLVNFLHTSIINASAESPGTLVLKFSNDEALEIYDTSQEYESYQITYGNKTIVV